MEVPTDFRKTPRQPQDKHFAINMDEMTGESNVQRYRKYPEYQDAEALARTCQLYAASYSQTMIMRIEKEDPNFFDDKEFNREEIIAKISHNMCLQIH
jgi:phosphoenolpyruvate synthase/pyruvate phosphate dikinase